ncbi:MAG: TPM domain-containing protein [Coprococcus sp.]|nr:TPM domain-containing protein [Coprococcus sp.]
MKRKKGIGIVFVVLVLALLCGGTAAANDTGYADRIWVRDEAGLMSEDEVAKLNEICGQISDEYNMGVSVVTVNSYGGGDLSKWQEGKYTEYELGKPSGGIMLALGMEEEQCGIAIFGGAGNVFTTDEQRKMINAFVSDLSGGEYYKAFHAYVERCDELLEKAQKEGGGSSTNPNPNTNTTPNTNPYPSTNSYTSTNSGERHVSIWVIVVIAFVISFIISLLIVQVWKGEMNTRGMQEEAVLYLEKDSFHLTRREDRFLYRTVKKRKKPESKKDSSSGKK